MFHHSCMCTSCVCHDSLECRHALLRRAAKVFLTCDAFHLYVCPVTHSRVLNMCAMTHSPVLHKCAMTHSCVLNMCAMTHSCVLDLCVMTHSCVLHMCAMTESGTGFSDEQLESFTKLLMPHKIDAMHPSARVKECVHTRTHVHTHAHTLSPTHTHTHTHKQTHMQGHTHTYAQRHMYVKKGRHDGR